MGRGGLGALAAALLVVVSLLLVGSPAFAAPPKHPPLAEALKGDARVLYDAARDLFKAGDYASAYAKFQRALELSNDPRLYWNLAACERKVKHNANVLRLLDTYLQAGEGWLSDEDRSEASRAASAVRSFVAAATVRTDPADGVDVFVDDVKIATTPQAKPLWIDMGSHRVRFAKEGYKTLERNEEIPAGGELHWSITLESNAAKPSPPPPSPPPPSPPVQRPIPLEPTRPSRTGPIILGGAGLALAGGGAALAIITTNRFSDLEKECGSSCDPKQWETDRTLQVVGDVLLIAGASAIVGAVVWWIVQPSASPPERVGKVTF
jgi:hypothetical protein